VKTKIKGLGVLHSFPFGFEPDRPVLDQLFYLQSKQITLPLPTLVMTPVHDFVVDLAKGGKSFKEIKNWWMMFTGTRRSRKRRYMTF
jgi:hypothetical protein